MPGRPARAYAPVRFPGWNRRTARGGMFVRRPRRPTIDPAARGPRRGVGAPAVGRVWAGRRPGPSVPLTNNSSTAGQRGWPRSGSWKYAFSMAKKTRAARRAHARPVPQLRSETSAGTADREGGPPPAARLAVPAPELAPEPVTPREQLVRADGHRQRAETAELLAVQAARAAGMSWALIAELLGGHVTGQRIGQKYRAQTLPLAESVAAP